MGTSESNEVPAPVLELQLVVFDRQESPI